MASIVSASFLLLFSIAYGRGAYFGAKAGQLRFRHFVSIKKENGVVLFWACISLLMLLALLFFIVAGLLVFSVYDKDVAKFIFG
ncbi:MAG TPA: hypothetical protein VMI53_07170 [Opitutaceae bacterium]|nr:hypothetical protein [Opitutaceae bacterium]